jgi:hypothetical protein
MKARGRAGATLLHMAAGVAVLVLLGAGSARAECRRSAGVRPAREIEPFLGGRGGSRCRSTSESDPMAAPRTVALRSRPAPEAADRPRGCVPTSSAQNNRYEESAALVYERRVDVVTFENGWYRVVTCRRTSVVLRGSRRRMRVSSGAWTICSLIG